MAININPGTPLRHVSTFNATGNFVAPQGKTIAFVALHSATGGGGGGGGGTGVNSANGGAGGTGQISGAFVQVIPGGTHSVTVGAAGTGGSATTNPDTTGGAGNTGGTTNFDGIFTQPGSSGGAGGNRARYSGNAGAAGAAAAAGSGTTSLTALSPGGALTRVGTISGQTTGAQASGAGGAPRAERYGIASAGAGGSAGQVNVYI